MSTELSRDLLLVGSSVLVGALGVWLMRCVSSSKPSEPAAPAKKKKKKAKAQPSSKKQPAAPSSPAKAKAKATKATKATKAKKKEPEAPPSPTKSPKRRRAKKKAAATEASKADEPTPVAAPEPEASTQEKREQRQRAKMEKAMKLAAKGGNTNGTSKAAKEAATNGDSSAAESGDDDGWNVVKKVTKVRKKKPAASAATNADEEATGPPATKFQMTVEARRLPVIIGSKGSTLHAVQDATGCRVELPQRSESGRRTEGTVSVTVTGPAEGVRIAAEAIEELCAKGYCRLTAGEDFVEKTIKVEQSSVPALIGSQGVIRQAIQDRTGVRMVIGDRAENATRAKVTLAGTKEAVALATQTITDITTKHYSEVTHPGCTHAEIAVPTSLLGRIIGPKGSEMRHIENNYKAKVHIPNDRSSSPNVVVVGTEEAVARASKHIHKLLEEIEIDRTPEDLDEDDWGAKASEPAATISSGGGWGGGEASGW